MAISEPIVNAPAPVVKDNRTWRIQIFCPSDLPVSQWRVEWLREVVQRDAQGNVVGERLQGQVDVGAGVSVPLTVSALAPDLLQESFTDPGTGKTMTGAEMMSMLAYIGDLRWQATAAAMQGGE
jgi:hypothetical protein